MSLTVHRTGAAFRSALDAERAAGHTIGFVPTMGALHAGHASLVERAASECDVVAVSIFVNPTQFGPNEDLAAYPRTPEADEALVERCGATHVLAPPVADMYGEGSRTTVTVAGVTEPMEGAHRPGHFDGVSTVVLKLFNRAGPCRAYFGEKDWQQLAVVRRMAADLDVPVTVVGCPTVREPDGLALSSRNVYLTPAERAAAPVLHAALTEAAGRIEAGERSAEVVRALLRARIEPVAPLDYGEVVDAATLERVDPLVGDLRLLVAARFGRARLIDNVGARAGAAG